MKLMVPLTFLILTCLACGGHQLEMKPVRIPASVVLAPEPEVINQRLFLSALEAKYKKENKAIKLAIVHSMLMELEEKYPSLPDSREKANVESLRKRPDFLSLELTIEHLSHREEVKQRASHSAFQS